MMKLKNLQLLLSSLVVIVVSFIYGGNPQKILPLIFDFEVQNLELKNIFRSIMGLYITIGLYWLYGVYEVTYWKSATTSNIIFMAGLAFGRLISLFLDGFSLLYSIGMLLEFAMAVWGYYNLKNYGHF
ncbi:DUF4345 domain-containing protein [Flavobacterium sp. ASW18X]|nr:DUF4345 domain-containing protein [Flavobacterium sp. ASW18X]